MHKVVFYQVGKSKQWRWKLMYNDSVLCRSDNMYVSRSAAFRSFKGVQKGIAKITTG